MINNRPNVNNANAFEGRIDYQATSKTRLFFRVNHFSQWDLTADTLKNGGFDYHMAQSTRSGLGSDVQS